MTDEKIKSFLNKNEGTHLEYKESKNSMPSDLFDTVCAFLNRDGGLILLGVNDDGQLVGIASDSVETIKKNIVTSSNDPECLNPPFLLNPQTRVLDGLNVISLNIPPGSQVFKHGNTVYYRENDSDLRITDIARITQIQLSKSTFYTESAIYSALSFSDFNPSLFKKARQLIKAENPEHPWLKVSDQRLLELANFKRKDFQTGQEGYTLASAIVFGNDNTVQQILPSYKVNALVRKENIDRYDDRLTLRTNLLDTYEHLMAFATKHFPDKFHTENSQRISLRTYIFREVVANILAHREYTNANPTSLIIFKNRIEITNPNNPHQKGPLDVNTFSPYPKNPTIAKFMIELGWVEEIGSGVINVNKYLPLYFEGCKPQFLENDIFTTILPTILNTFGEKIHLIADFLTLDFNRFKQPEFPILQDLPLNISSAEFSTDDEFVFNLVSTWLQESIKVTSLDIYNKKNSPDLNSWQATSSADRGIKLFGRKFVNIFKVLFVSISESSLASLMYKIGYSNRVTFNKLYLRPLISNELIALTLPDTPTSPNQKYIISEKGRLLLGGYKLS